MDGIGNKKVAIILLVFQALFIVLFAVFMEYDDSGDPHKSKNATDRSGYQEVEQYYAMFQDVHVMIFIGFGFLMTFLRRYGFGAVSLNMLIAAYVLQWSLLVSGFFNMTDFKAKINLVSLLNSDIAAAAVLITFGSLLGKTSPIQLIVVAFIEIVVFTGNMYIGGTLFGAQDVGGSMFIHAFGAYFGLACSRVMWTRDLEDSTKEGSNYHSDIFSMIGTVFLWLFWPSFNAALSPDADGVMRAIINTYLSIAACCVITFVFSSLVDPNGKFEMVHVQNSTLAGGVAIGTSADLMVHPWGAVLIGSIAGMLSVVGFRFITPFMASRLKIHDTCGVNNLHGMPGVLAGLLGALFAGVADVHTYGYSLYEIFPFRAPLANSTELAHIQQVFSPIEAGLDWTAATQAGYQMGALGVTLALAMSTGALTGLVISMPVFDAPRGNKIFDDGPFWVTPDDFSKDLECNYPAPVITDRSGLLGDDGSPAREDI